MPLLAATSVDEHRGGSGASLLTPDPPSLARDSLKSPLGLVIPSACVLVSPLYAIQTVFDTSSVIREGTPSPCYSYQ